MADMIRENPDPRTMDLREACRSEQAALAYVQPAVERLAGDVRQLRDRWERLQAALVDAPVEAPPPTFVCELRHEDLSAIEQAGDPDLLSLDIFDTCLVRHLSSPEDVFVLLGDHVQRISGTDAEAFAAARVEAENRLRHEGLEAGGPEDTSFSDIYDALAERFGWDAATAERIRQAELRLEAFFLCPVEVLRRLAWARARQHKPLAYASEMYLAGADLAVLLAEAGFPVEGVPVYSSGEYGLSKGTGNLYRRVREDFSGKDFLHVGDNPVSDGEVPAREGWRTALVRTHRRSYPDLLSNILATAVETFSETGNFWEDFGFRVAGPVHFAYAAYLYRTCQHNVIGRMYFLSRDGWFPRKVFERLQADWGEVAEARYLYASREYLGLGAMAEIGPEEWDFLLKPSPLLTGGDVLGRAGIPEQAWAEVLAAAGLPGPEQRLCHHWGFVNPRDRDRLYAAICSRIGDFLAYRETVRESLRTYLDEAGIFDAPSAFADLGWGGSSFTSLARMTPPDTPVPRGLYFALLKEAPEGAESWFTGGLAGAERAGLLKGSIALMEFLFGSPEPSVRRMERRDGGLQPVFRQPWAARDLAAWDGMEKGLIRFVETMLEVCAAPPPGDGIPFVEDCLRRWIFNPSVEELRQLGPLVHAEGWGTENRLRMLPDLERMADPGVRHEAFCYCQWKPGLRRLLFPFSI